MTYDGVHENTLHRDVRVADIQRKVALIAGLFTAAVCAGTIDPDTSVLVDRAMLGLARKISVDYGAIRRREEAACAGKSMAALAPAIPVPDTAGAAQQDIPVQSAVYGPDAILPSAEYARRLRPTIVSELLAESEAQRRELDERITALDVVPPSWRGTAKDYSASTKRQRAGYRAERNDVSQRVTRLRSGDLTAQDEDDIHERSDARRMRSGSRLTADENAAFLDGLLRIAFTEEQASEQFYPTPDDIIQRYIVPALSFTPGMHLLEPSAGRGSIADALRQACPACQIDVCEINSVRRDILAMKGYRVVGDDFMRLGVSATDDKGRSVLDDVYRGRYDAIVMNPPFNHGVGMAHVRRAYDLLKSGGTLVSILPESNLFGDSRQAVAFQRWATEHGSDDFRFIDASEYNEHHDRRITISIGVLTIRKPTAEQEPDRQAGAEEDGDYRRQIDAYRSAAAVPMPTNSEPDAGFIPPSIVTANADLAQKPKNDVIPPHLKLPFIKQHVLDGANLAIEALDRRGGFLLADGTGAGKTIQALLVAAHHWKAHGRPVLIFTVDERVLQTSFMDDARRLGFLTPDAVSVDEDHIPPRPKNYAGLYGLEGEPISVWRHGFGLDMRPGINLCTYHDLSQYKGGEEYKKEIRKAEGVLADVMREYRKKKEAALDMLNQAFPKNPQSGKREPTGYQAAKDAALAALQDEYMVNHPVHVELQRAREKYQRFITEQIALFAANTVLVVFDEAHKIKNAGDGTEALSRRALLGLALVNYCPRVMYVTATPADRPIDILYLKRAGLFKGEEQFSALMYYIGYEWKEAVKNKSGFIIRPAQWKEAGGRGDTVDMRLANATMSSAFDMLTEDGQMIRREIQMTNLTVEMHRIEAPQSARDRMEQILDAYTTADEHGVPVTDYMSAYARQMEELEPYKIPKTLELVDSAIARGRQVILFVHTVDEGTEERVATGSVKPGAVRLLKQVLSERYGEDAVGVIVGTSGDYEDYRRMQNVRDFQSGKRRILIGTIMSGGTGLNLDDTTGHNPREMVIVTPPLSFINVVQAIGRVVRANTKSRSTAHFVFTSNTDVDKWLSRILATKFSSLAAIVKGESSRLDPGALAAMENTGESGVAGTIGEQARGGAAIQQVRHSRLSKSNQRVEGWMLPSAIPYYAELSGTPSRPLIALGARDRQTLGTFMDNNADFITRWKLTLNPDRDYQRRNGSFLGRQFSGRTEPGFLDAWEALLNVVDFQVLAIPVFTQQPMALGEEVRFEQDIPYANIARGMTGRIVNVRKPRLDGVQWLFDVDIGGTVVKGVEYFKLRTTTVVPMKYKVGSEYQGRKNYLPGIVHVMLRIVSANSGEYTVQTKSVVVRSAPSAPSIREYPYGRPENIPWQEAEIMQESELDRYIAMYEMACGSGCPQDEYATSEGDVPYRHVADNVAPLPATHRLRERIDMVEQLLHEAIQEGRVAPGVGHEVQRRLVAIRERLAASGGPTCPPRQPDGKLCTSESCLSILETACEHGEQTIRLHTDASGRLTEDRKRLHDRIVQTFKGGRPCVKTFGRRPVAILMGGAPGSGKSHYLKGQNLWQDTGDVLHIDADAIRALLPEYQGWNATLTQSETKVIVERLIAEIGTPCEHDIVYDGTMNNATTYAGLVSMLKQRGYEVFIVYARVPQAVSQERVLQRYATAGRYVPRYVIRDFYAKGESAFEAIRKNVDGWILVDGTTGRTIESGGKSIPAQVGRGQQPSPALPTPGVEAQSAFTVHSVPIGQIHTDPERFQPRTDFSEEKVRAIIEAFDSAFLTPLTIWKDPANARYYVLAGHHRLEALRRMKWTHIPVRFFVGTERDAIMFAWESNSHGRMQSDDENARYLRKLLDTGSSVREVKERCRALYDQSCRTVWLLSQLDDDGLALSYLREFPKGTDDYRDAETMAKWVGRIKEKYAGMSRSQENEIINFLRQNYKTAGRRFRSLSEFEAHMGVLIARRFPLAELDPDVPLNPSGMNPQTDVERAYDERIREAERELNDARTAQDRLQRQVAEAREKGTVIGMTQRGVDDALHSAHERVILAQRTLLTLRAQERDVKASAREAQAALF